MSVCADKLGAVVGCALILPAPRPAAGHCPEGSPAHLLLPTCIYICRKAQAPPQSQDDFPDLGGALNTSFTSGAIAQSRMSLAGPDKRPSGSGVAVGAWVGCGFATASSRPHAPPASIALHAACPVPRRKLTASAYLVRLQQPW